MKPLPPPDRYLDCQFALEPSFQALAETCEAQGWSSDEVAYALLGLAEARLLTLAANEQVEDTIKLMRERRGEHQKKQQRPSE